MSATIQSLDRGLQLLSAVGAAGRPMSLTELTEVIGIDPSSVCRLANTLKTRGFFDQSPETKAYTLGPTIWQLAGQIRRFNPLLQSARQHVLALSELTGETAHLGVRDGDRVVIVECALTNHAIGVSAECGQIEPLHCTALGKALIADLDAEQLKSLFGTAHLPGHTPRTIRSIRDLAADCAKINARGYAIDDEERHMGLRCVAAAIRDFDGEIVASIGMSAPLARLPKRQFSDAARHVKAAVVAIGAKLGNIQAIQEKAG